jgi:hypothetical protein
MTSSATKKINTPSGPLQEANAEPDAFLTHPLKAITDGIKSEVRSRASAKFGSKKKKKIFFSGSICWTSLTAFTGLDEWTKKETRRGKEATLTSQKKSNFFFSHL